MEELHQLDISMHGLNDIEFNTLISNPTNVSIFSANINNMNLLTPEQLDIINNL
jgi:hypothetical protein